MTPFSHQLVLFLCFLDFLGSVFVHFKELKERVKKMKESGSTVPCLHFREQLLVLAKYAKSGRVDSDFVSWLRNSILEGKFSENNRMLQDVLGI